MVVSFILSRPSVLLQVPQAREEITLGLRLAASICHTSKFSQLRPYSWLLGISYFYWLDAPSVDRKRAVIGQGAGSASRRGLAELAESP